MLTPDDEFGKFWPDAVVEAAMEEYMVGLGTKHTERLISKAQFIDRLLAFEQEVGDWLDNGRKLKPSTVARRWAKRLGIESYNAIPRFERMWQIVDSRYPIS